MNRALTNRIPHPKPRIPIPRTLFAFFLAIVCVGCGRKGAPLPPLVRLPQPPSEVIADRHGGTVDLHFVVPATNIDGSRPANVKQIEIYAITGPATATEEQILKAGTKIATVAVKAPRDPNQAIEEDEPAADMDPPEGRGLDQGTTAHVVEKLGPDAEVPVDLTKVGKPKKTDVVAAPIADDTKRPLLSPAFRTPSRMYVGVPITTKGKRGPMSGRALVAMVDPPPTVATPTVEYNEKAITVSWPPIPGSAPPPVATTGLLPSRPIGPPVPTISYNVYEVSSATPPELTRLTKGSLLQTTFSDARMVWGERRCYAIRALKTIGNVELEGTESEPRCETLKDTFPPAAPTGLQAVPSDGAINLIWDANTEKDIKGYLVLRGIAPAESLEPITREPIQETSFKENVKPGVRFVFAVQAVDAAGNISPVSARVEETAR